MVSDSTIAKLRSQWCAKCEGTAPRQLCIQGYVLCVQYSNHSVHWSCYYDAVVPHMYTCREELIEIELVQRGDKLKVSDGNRTTVVILIITALYSYSNTWFSKIKVWVIQEVRIPMLEVLPKHSKTAYKAWWRATQLIFEKVSLPWV